ncbi:hypothetical protein COLO4_06272 [Corchorus olitorius]|uniref:Uncharacterized protein n=1 Tax=Corchorus olitorius TaxID=93759 RepID=A0A1R3KNI4_9ROSI|nr:hypothetical protein COLO4_06272 [Corchorus olitorius]
MKRKQWLKRNRSYCSNMESQEKPYRRQWKSECKPSDKGGDILLPIS